MAAGKNNQRANADNADTRQQLLRQVAALCYRQGEAGKEVLLITSRDTGRWIIPKGWPIIGKDAPQAAMQEAWEEAGVKSGRIKDKAVGTYRYEKNMPKGEDLQIETQVFAVKVGKLKSDYPEVAERRRKWVRSSKAANMVDEPELQKILRDI